MNEVVEALLDIVETNALPAADTSSHWQRYGRETIVERQDNGVILRGAGFGVVQTTGLYWRLVHMVERWTYRHTTAGLKSYRSVWRTAITLASDLSFDLTFDIWKQAVALALLTDHWEANNLSPRTFALIGDGYGFLGALIRRRIRETRIYCIDLPKMLVFQAHTHELADPSAKMSLLRRSESGGPDVVFALPQDIEIISDPIDCAINMASMQEMKPSSIQAYFAFLRRRSGPESRFYCVNRLRKELPGGEVADFYGYPWREDDEVFIDEPCPYYRYFLSPSTLHKGLWFVRVRIPFANVNYFDGITMHRLAHLAPLS